MAWKGVAFCNSRVSLCTNFMRAQLTYLATLSRTRCGFGLGRGVTVGSNSFGKGKIQAVFGLSDGEGMTMTVAQYVTPGGTVIQSKGLKPDIEIPTVNAYVNMIGGGVFSEPDLSKLDVNKAKQILSQCQPAPAASQNM